MAVHRAKPWGRQQSSSSRLISVGLRLFVYYLIYLSVWQCPPGTQLDDTEGSVPALCYPLQSVFGALTPHVRQLHDKYAAPYVAKAEPYFAKGQAVYGDYVHPRVTQLTTSVNKITEPYQQKVRDLHAARVQPYYDTVAKFHADKIDPYVQASKRTVDHTYSTYVQPGYDRIHPHVVRGHQYTQQHVFPRVSALYAKGRDHVTTYTAIFLTWFKTAVSPKLVSVYRDAVEPQLNKIHDRVASNQRTDSENVDSSSSSALAKEMPVKETTAEETVTDKTVAGETTSDELPQSTAEISTSESTAVSSVPAESTVEEDESVHTTAEGSTTGTPVVRASEAPIETRAAASISEELKNWNSIVETTTREAFAAFLDDVETEKFKLMDSSKPEFTELLQTLQKREQEAFTSLVALTSNLEQAATEDDLDLDDEKLSAGYVQQEFRRHADEIREAALAVRSRAEGFAEQVLDRTEEVRKLTIEVLEEFAEVTLQELGRKMVSADSLDSSTSSSGDGPKTNWRDWKEFRSLKDRLLLSRRDISEHDINTADVNKMLREAQETANILAKEAAQFLSNLRSKADYHLQDLAVKRSQKLAALGLEEDVDFPADAVVYEELESETSEGTTKKSTTSETVDRFEADAASEESDNAIHSNDYKQETEKVGTKEDDGEQEEDDEEVETIVITSTLTHTETRSDTRTISAN